MSVIRKPEAIPMYAKFPISGKAACTLGSLTKLRGKMLLQGMIGSSPSNFFFSEEEEDVVVVDVGEENHRFVNILL